MLRILNLLIFVGLVSSIGCAGEGSNDSSEGDTGAGDDSSMSDSDSSSGSDTGTDPGDVPADGPTAVEAAAGMGLGFNLGQMFENTQHPRTLEAAQAKIDAYYEKGFRNVRIPITWTENVGGDMLVNDPAVGDVNREHPRLLVIEQVVDHALSKDDMYVVINTHHESALKTNNRADVLEQLWMDIADIFKTRDHRLIFELINEPHLSDGDSSPMPPENVRAMSGLAYRKIRAIDTKRIIAIGGNQWFSAGEMATTWPHLDDVGGGDDQYLMATFHHYDPWSFCGDNQGDYADEWTEHNLSSPMDIMLNWAATVGGGMPYYIGEWGVGWQSVLPAMDCNNIREWYRKFDSEFAAPRGIPTMVWDDGGWFRIFSHATNEFSNNLIDCIVGECDWTGTERFNDACLP